MIVNVTNSHSINGRKLPAKKTKVSFRATPVQVLQKLDSARVCPGKKMMLMGIGKFFEAAEKQMSKIKDAPTDFVYKLGEKNKIPESLATIKIGESTMVSFDEKLNKTPFKCSPTSKCSCGKGKSIGAFAADLLEGIGVDKPKEIKISKNK